MKKINENPFRFLGVYSNASAKDISSHFTKASAYAKTLKSICFDEEMSQVLPPINRTSTSLQNAKNQINLPEDKLKFALFWFCCVSPIDKVALGHLQVGDIHKALEIYGKQTNYSAFINKGVILLMQNAYDKDGIAYILKVIHDSRHRNAFVKAICGDIFQIEEERLSHILIDELLSEIPANVLYNIYQAINISPSDCDYLKEKAIVEPIEKINNAIEQARSISSNDANANYSGGVYLVNQTEHELAQVMNMIGQNDLQYQRLADTLSKTILQCSINYFNNTSTIGDIKYQKSLQLANYSLKIAQGNITKSRCAQAIKTLEEQRRTHKIETDLNSIADSLSSFQTQSATLENASSLVNTCKPHLQNIKNTLGSTDNFYLKISSAVANNALGMCINVVNTAQNNSSNLAVLQKTINNALSTMRSIGSLDMTTSERNHYNTNLSTLNGISTQVSQLSSILNRPTNSLLGSTPSNVYTGGLTTNGATKPTSPHTNGGPSNTGSNYDINWGCIIWIIFFIIIIICSLAGC